MDMILNELEGMCWDVIVLTETKRETTDERLEVQGGHMFYGSGGCKRRRGVGFLVHQRLAKHKFVAVSECLGVLELNTSIGDITIFGV